MANGVFDGPLEIEFREEAPEVDFEAFAAVARSRRSVRVYQSEAIPDEVVERCLDLALIAPSSSNLQPWEFHWARSSELREQVVEACLGQPAASTAPVLIACVARTATWRRNARDMAALLKAQTKPAAPKAVLAYYEKLIPFVQTIGWFGVIGFFKWIALSVASWIRPTPMVPCSRASLELWAVKSTALACENLMLAFRAAGYDSCPMEGMDERRLKSVLDLPRDARVVMVISAGRRAGRGVYGPQLRFPRERFIFKK